MRALAGVAAGAALLAPLALPSAAAAAPSPLVTAGKHLYGEYCLSCHGANGAGRTTKTTVVIGAGPWRAQEQQRGIGPSLRGVGAEAADFYLRKGYMPLAHVGLQPMPGPQKLADAQIAALVAYIASLAPGPPIPHPRAQAGSVSLGERLFTDHCAGCHQIVGEGGYVTGAIAVSLSGVDPVEIAEAVRIGPYVMPRFSVRAISNAQLDSIIAYVEYTRHPDDFGGFALGHIGPVTEGLVTWLVAAVVLIGFCALIGSRNKAPS